MSLEQKQWRFNEQVAPIFDKHVRQSVPGYSRIQESVATMTDFFSFEGGTVLDLGCATGETLHLIQQKTEGKSLRLVGFDESPSMIQEAMRKTKGKEDFSFHCSHIEEADFPDSTQVVTSILTMQFIRKRHREDVVRKVYESLDEGGAFLFVEKCYAESGQIQDLFTQLYHDFKENQGLSPDSIRNKDKSLRGMMSPHTFMENERLLHEAGFQTVELFFKDLHFAGWIALK